MKARNRTAVSSLALLVLATASVTPWAWSRFEAVRSANDWNAQAIARIQEAAPSDGVVFAVMGDSRGGREVFRRILADLSVERPAFAIHTGDFVTYGQASEYAEFVRLLRGCPTPLPTVIGNHEIVGGGRTRYEDLFGSPYYSFSVGECLFVVVDDANKKDIGHEQMLWLRTQLRRDVAHKFVFLHVPPFDPRGTEAEAGSEAEHCLDSRESAEEFMRIVRQNNVDVVFASHIHGYFNAVRDGVRYVISGGAGATLHGSTPAAYFHHYLLMTVRGAEVRVEVRRIAADGRQAPCSRPSGSGSREASPTIGQPTNGRKN